MLMSMNKPKCLNLDVLQVGDVRKVGDVDGKVPLKT